MASKPEQKRKRTRIAVAVAVLFLLSAGALFMVVPRVNLNPNLRPGDAVDSLDGVVVYFNGGVGQVHGRNSAEDGYNIGLKYQCVEFVKRYYLEHYQHQMPDPWGHAYDFFDSSAPEGGINQRRGLIQYKNPGSSPPRKGDILVFGRTLFNRYGHVAIVSKAEIERIEIIQQNPGPFAPSREWLPLELGRDGYGVQSRRVLGWLRLPLHDNKIDK